MEEVVLAPYKKVPPGLQELAAVLARALPGTLGAHGRLAVVHRESLEEGTFPKEIVIGRFADGTVVRLFCKYSSGHNHDAHGHRGGVALEASVYRELLQPLGVCTPALYHIESDVDSDEIWLIFEYLGDSIRVAEAEDPGAMGVAARWIGQFHAACTERLRTTAVPYLKAYSEDYYLGWAERTLQYLAHHQLNVPWMAPLRTRFGEAVAVLLAESPTIIHGEYYPKNILYRRGRIYPVDWESAALAAGVIDLASLTEGWAEEVVTECVQQYQAARWPSGTSEGINRRLCAARLYLHFRWLGDRPLAHVPAWRIDGLYAAGRYLGLV